MLSRTGRIASRCISRPQISNKSNSVWNTKTYSTEAPLPVTHLTEEENILRDTVRRFSEEKIRPLVNEMDRSAKMDQSVIDACFEAGFMGLEIPHEYGGAGMDLFSSVLTIEELARVDASVSVMVDVQNTLVNLAILGAGSEEQKSHWLPKLSSDTLGSFCLSEWGSGSDAFALKCRAELTTSGDEYVLNGTKAWITNASQANFFIVMANVAPEKGYKGITAFLVERSNPGLVVGKPEDKLGIRASSTCEVQLNNCVVSKNDVLGEVGKGYKIAIETLNKGRIGIGAQMLGIAQGAFDLTVPYLTQRKQFNTAICDFQSVQHQIARAAIDIQSARLLVYNAARGANSEIECSMAKLVASEVAERVSSTCLNLLGGVGQTREFGVEKYFRDCKIGQIYEGTSNIQLQTIAKNIIRPFKANN